MCCSCFTARRHLGSEGIRSRPTDCVTEMAPVEVRALQSLPTTKMEMMKAAKALVEKAIKMHKVFSVQGHYPVIRAGLRARGWVERYLPNAGNRVSSRQSDKDKDDDDGNTEANNSGRIRERGDTGEEDELDQMYSFMSHLVRNEKTYFYWSGRFDSDHFRSLTPNQLINHYANTGNFTTKVGLCVNLRNLKWYDTADPDAFFPRCYRLGAKDERHAFIDDFRRTACCSLIKHVVETNKKQETTNQQTKDEGNTQNVSPVSPGVIKTALQRCQEYLSSLEHCDIDVTVETLPFVEDNQWNQFLQKYYMVVHDGASIMRSADFVSRCQDMLVQLKEVCPQLEIDGFNNIWIIKPGAMSRGRGIVCMNRLDQILALVESDTVVANDSKWVVQKYLEQPLLIKGTKFDLRQWFLVTDWNPLTVWFYKDCYLRFSTQPYSTKRLDSSVHLCNNSIQKHLQPSRERHPGLPRDNIWSSSDLKAFLHQQGQGAKWESVVVPGMQQAVVHVLQTAQDQVKHRKAAFELYGADFMLGNDMKPWLLEVNTNPTMACSSVVTARLCPAVQMDTLKVVLDRRKNPNAFTGGFHLIYKQPRVNPPPFVGLRLIVEGNHIKTPNSTKCKQRPPQTQFSPEDKEKTTKRQAKPCRKIHVRRPPPEKKSKTPPRREEERTVVQNERTVVQNERTVVQNERTVVPNAIGISGEQVVENHNEPSRTTQCLVVSGDSSVAPVAQRRPSFSRTPKSCSVSHVSKTSIKPNPREHVWRSILPGTSFFPRPLLCLTSMQPNILPSYRKRSMVTFQHEANYRFHKQRYIETMSRYVK
ncbi:tubulin monoglycylase TTLL3-like isoform X1 [Corythoichthys intestinalis]|uniref:tubulin monoglycylase TTLL3-like isoform X1 n=3 Tax=Corythoichthys intestinalis TaxID=161448 RepID=UPI0025A4FF27|nr:tubulin monoglycylase TTLL3-like isoform X1 [Corythoichthys intestinalis]